MLFLVTGPLPLAIVTALLFGPLAGWLAGRADRSRYMWFLYGVITGPVAPLLVLLAPPGRCRACMSPSAGWLSACPACGLNVRTGRPPKEPAIRIAAGATLRQASAGVDSREAPAAEAPPPLAPVGLKRPEAPTSSIAAGRVAGVPPAAPELVAAAHPAPTLMPGIDAWTAPTHTRATTTARPIDHPPSIGQAAPGQFEILATGVYHGGSESLVLGYRYLIGRHEHRLLVLGPLHETPNTVRVEHPLADLEVYSAMGGALITASARRGKRMLALRFVSVAGMSDRSLEEALVGRSETESGTPAPSPAPAATGPVPIEPSAGEAQTAEDAGAAIPASRRARVARGSATRRPRVEPPRTIEPSRTIEPPQAVEPSAGEAQVAEDAGAAIPASRRARVARGSAMRRPRVEPPRTIEPLRTIEPSRTIEPPQSVAGAPSSSNGNGQSPGTRWRAQDGPALDPPSPVTREEPAARGPRTVPGRRTRARS